MSSASAGKRQREKKLQERAAQKRQRRADRATRTETETDAPDSEALMERFHLVSAAFASGAIERDAYEAERRAILSELGLDAALDD